MHWEGIMDCDRKALLENRKNLRHELFKNASSKKKYLEILVAQKFKGYKKGKSLGTAVGTLIRTMRG